MTALIVLWVTVGIGLVVGFSVFALMSKYTRKYKRAGPIVGLGAGVVGGVTGGVVVASWLL